MVRPATFWKDCIEHAMRRTVFPRQYHPAWLVWQDPLRSESSSQPLPFLFSVSMCSCLPYFLWAVFAHFFRALLVAFSPQPFKYKIYEKKNWIKSLLSKCIAHFFRLLKLPLLEFLVKFLGFELKLFLGFCQNLLQLFFQIFFKLFLFFSFVDLFSKRITFKRNSTDCFFFSIN